MIRLYIWGWYSQDCSEVIHRLTQNNICNVVNSEMSKSPETLDKIIHTPHLLDFTIRQCPLFSAKKITEINDYKHVFFETYSRVRAASGLSYQELDHLFWLYVNYFGAEIENKRPDKIFFNSPPHYGADIVLYALGKVLGIEVQVFMQSIFPDRFFVVSDVEEFGAMSSLPKKSVANYKVKGFIKKELFYMKNMPNLQEPCVWNLLKQFTVKAYSKKTLKRSGALQKFNDCLAYKKSREKYVVKNVDMQEKFVYFPLQLQPEMTTSLLGGKVFSNQLNALEALLKVIPDDWLVYVKENPKQTSLQRGELFFKRLVSDSRVKYVDRRMNSFRLIEESQFVAVVTGTAGWEAVLLGKAVLSFGYAWFNPLQGVTTYKEFTNIDSLMGTQINSELLENSFNHLMERSFTGVVDPNYSSIVENYSSLDNQRKIYDAVKGFLV